MLFYNDTMVVVYSSHFGGPIETQHFGFLRELISAVPTMKTSFSAQTVLFCLLHDVERETRSRAQHAIIKGVRH